MELICAIEGDQGAPIRMWATANKIDRKFIKKFIDKWVDTFMPSTEFSDCPTKKERDEIVRGLINDGDSWWYDETWCFQIHREQAEV